MHGRRWAGRLSALALATTAVASAPVPVLGQSDADRAAAPLAAVPQSEAWPTLRDHPGAAVQFADPQLVDPTDSPSLARAVVSSAIIPGAGQWMRGQRRWIAYLALEATAVLFTLERRRAGANFRDSYRDLAWDVARNGAAVGRIDLDFEYYERIANFSSSGSFDADGVSPGIQPESDPSTYNGQVWEIARGLFLRGVADPAPTDAGYDRALEYYAERSYDDRFLWDWGDESRARTEYRGLISDSDEAFRTGTVLLGVAVANHLVSAIDAFLSTRGSQANLARRLEFGWAPSSIRDSGWEIQLRVNR